MERGKQMGRAYAVLDGAGKIVTQTAAFRPEAVTEEVPLSGGFRLLITGSDELQQQLDEAQAENRAKETFLSNMSHDIRTPMNAIVGMTALAKRHMDERERVVDALGKIEVASSHLLSLINDVLDISRINAGRLVLNADRFALNDLIHDMVIMLRPQIQKRHHHFTLTADEVEAEVLRGDVLRLRQIFVNIISNAVKYTGDGGEIAVTFAVRREGNGCRLRFECSDNGMGMSKEFLERIFVPFERVKSSTHAKVEGTGLGMSIVKRLTEAAGGTVEIWSEQGKGTRVTVSLPLGVEPVELQTAALRGQRWLVLEGDPTLQQKYRTFLGEAQVDCRLVQSPSEILAAITDAEFRGEAVSGVILGSVCGEGDPLNIASYLHKAHPRLPLVYISGENWEEMAYRGRHSGISRFIPLPLFRLTLLQGLTEVIQGSDGMGQDYGTPDLTGKRLLLVEDNMINREIALEILRTTGAQIDTAEDGQQAVDAYEAQPEGTYTAILMDVQMPVMDGYAATRAIRGSGRADAETIPIYAMTANTFAEDIAKSREAGMNGHLAKPIDMEVLMQVLRKLC